MNYEDWKRQDWDRAHEEQDITALTGSDLDNHLLVLGAKELLRDDTVFLCVGVGTGGWVCEAGLAASEVWALDISSKANHNLPDEVSFTTNPALLPSDHFDLALSLWVAPHMNNHDLEDQLREVIRSLKGDGIFAIHYKAPLDDSMVVDNREGADDEWDISRRAMMLRRAGHFAEMVHRAGGFVVTTAAEYSSPFHQITEVSVHVRRSP